MSNILDYIENTKSEICYCEACIDPNGNVFNAIPSHLHFLVRQMKESEEEIYNLMPVHAAPIHWMIEHSGWVALWYNFGISDEMSEEQVNSLRLLQESGRISDPYMISIPKEKSVCGTRDNPEEFEKLCAQRRTLVLVNGSFLASIEGYEI